MTNKISRPEFHQSDSFYVTGGTLRQDAECYVTRLADQQLYESVRQGQFCYVLTSRQMGKSSLMIRTAARLREAGIGVAVLDLTAIGQNLTAEQWYDGLLSRIGRQLQLEEDLDEFWFAHPRLGPLQRWMSAIDEVVLPRYPGNLVIFIDEIDTVKSLPFSTDEFFAGIREFYNRRTAEPELERLTFCLLGVAAPSDLIRDTRTTPFNIGQRIELHDFNEDEALPLAEGLGMDEKTGAELVSRVIYWTGGHPYLTQRLCRALVEDEALTDARGVDRKCEQLFFNRRAQEGDDNLIFVRERILRSEVELAGLLTLYDQVHRGKRVEGDETSQMVTVLRLSGITRVENGNLKVRNRIYKRVFDLDWVKEHMPDAELRRQQVAYRKGLLRAGTSAAVILTLIATLTIIAWQQRNRAITQEQMNYRQLYVAQMNLAGQSWESANPNYMNELLHLYLPQSGREDLRGVEWYMLWNLGHSFSPMIHLAEHSPFIIFIPEGRKVVLAAGNKVKIADFATGHELATLSGHTGAVYTADISNDGLKLVTGSLDGSVRLWELATGKELLTRSFDGYSIANGTLSPNGHHLVTIAIKGRFPLRTSTVKLWETDTGKELLDLSDQSGWVVSAVYSPDGKLLALGKADGSVGIFDAISGRELHHLEKQQRLNPGTGVSVAFSPDGRRLITNVANKTKVWDVTATKETFSHENMGMTGIMSSDGNWLATGDLDGTVRLFDAATGKELSILKGHKSTVLRASFSPDSKLLATASMDSSVKLWNVSTGKEVSTLKGHNNQITSVVFSPNSKWLATASIDNTVRIWDLALDIKPIVISGKLFESAAFTSDSKKLVTEQSDNAKMTTDIKYWDVSTGKETEAFKSMTLVLDAALSPDNQKLATGNLEGGEGIIRVWDLVTGKETQTIRAHRDNWISNIRFSRDGGRVITSSNDTTQKIWDLYTGRQLLLLKGHEDLMETMDVSPDGKTLATGGHDRTVRLWDINNGREFYSFKGHRTIIYSLAFSPNGRILATGGEDRLVKLWDLITKQEIATLKGHNNNIISIAFSPDGRRLATGSHDNTAKIWDWASGQPLLTLNETGPVKVAFSPDGAWFATCNDYEQTTKLWRVATEQEISKHINH